jgi:sugar phosphate isomerase/epimerase
MLKGINYWAFSPSLTPAQVFALAHDAGFDGVELTFAETDGPVSFSTTRADCEALAALAKENGIKLYSLA